MEDWQQWQVRADKIAVKLQLETTALETEFFGETSDSALHGFWPKFRDLKERVRTAPAIKLEAKLDLERRLRSLGSRAYKAQEGAYAQSGERKTDLLTTIQDLRQRAEAAADPRDLRTIRREVDAVRQRFDRGAGLVPADRQGVWEAWRDTNQYVWQRLSAIWDDNETLLRSQLDSAREALENRDAPAVRQTVGLFFETLRTHEAKQNAVNVMKSEAERIRRDAAGLEERKAADKAASQQAQVVHPLQSWRGELERNREAIQRASVDVAELETRFEQTESLLEQAMVRGTLVDKRRKLAELERTRRTLEQRIEQSEESPLISVG